VVVAMLITTAATTNNTTATTTIIMAIATISLPICFQDAQDLNTTVSSRTRDEFTKRIDTLNSRCRYCSFICRYYCPFLFLLKEFIVVFMTCSFHAQTIDFWRVCGKVISQLVQGTRGTSGAGGEAD
jgi:hypothetical protein